MPRCLTQMTTTTTSQTMVGNFTILSSLEEFGRVCNKYIRQLNCSLTGQPRHLSQSFRSFLLFNSHRKHYKYLGRELNHGSIASVISFHGHCLSHKYLATALIEVYKKGRLSTSIASTTYKANAPLISGSLSVTFFGEREKAWD